MKFKSMENVNVDLRLARLKANMTIKEVSEKVGVSPINYSKYESGKYVPSVLRAMKIMDALGVNDIKEIFGSLLNEKKEETDLS